MCIYSNALYFQLTPPPYELKIDQACYWRNQPVTIHLQGVNESVWYKGFVIQPFEWKDGQTGERYVKQAQANWKTLFDAFRMGQLMRLDDNGSWQQQCFRFKNSATHSHDEKKKHIRLWWKIDEDSRTVQFVYEFSFSFPFYCDPRFTAVCPGFKQP
ncbi:hypothetical protein ANCCAN_11840 [Ancylostoma caninum]|uniref:Reelin domain-containing protein n=1 Tax=Ancylostoma caninum TaxID=29170 RepID=A0A368GCX2_ANCCA|nr:hypothetical protein ANCCAN_11840 [Ancylostoma caninum]